MIGTVLFLDGTTARLPIYETTYGSYFVYRGRYGTAPRRVPVQPGESVAWMEIKPAPVGA